MKITKEGIAILENDTHISKWVEESGRLDHDQNMLPLVLEYIKPGDTVIDCGAFIGDHTIAYLNKVGVEGTVIAFEPNEEAFDCLKYNTRNFSNCYCYNNVVCDSVINSYQIHSNPNAGASVASGGSIVRGITIDSLRLEKCDFIKIDVEGFEFSSLKGANGTISRLRPKLLIEINEGALKQQGVIPGQIFNFLLGYDIHNIYSEQKMEGPQFDIICVHKSKMK